MVGIDTELIVVKKVGELTLITDPIGGNILYDDGSSELKKFPLSHIEDRITEVQTGFNLGFLKANSSNEAGPTGLYIGQASEAGTFINFGNLVINALDFLNIDGKAFDVFIQVKDGVISKEVRPKGITIADNSISPIKTNFFGAKNANLADTRKKKKFFRVNETNGIEDANPDYDTYSKIPVESNTDYYWNNWTTIAWYDADQNFISGELLGGYDERYRTSPANAKFISIGFQHDNQLMMAESSVFVDYVQFELGIDKKYLPEFGGTLDLSSIADGEIPSTKIAGNIEKVSILSQYYSGAGNNTATGSGNYGAGFEALKYVTTAIGNVAIGLRALSKNATGNGNVAVGAEAMRESINCYDCTFVGWEAGQRQTEGVGDTGSGRRTMQMALNSGNNTGYGDSNLFRNQPNPDPNTRDGKANVSVGYVCMEYGQYTESIGLGRSTGRYLTGIDNVYIGTAVHPGVIVPENLNSDTREVLVTTAERNVAIGHNSMYGAKSTNDNIAIGAATLYNVTTAIRNIAIGSSAGSGITDGSTNIFIGYGVGTSSGSIENSIVIAYNTQPTNSNQIIIGNDDHETVSLAGVEFEKDRLMQMSLGELKNQKTGLGLKIWVGTEAEYAAIPVKDDNTLYIK